MIEPSDLIKGMYNAPPEDIDRYRNAVESVRDDLVMGVGVIGTLMHRAVTGEMEGEEAIDAMMRIGTMLQVTASLIEGLNAAQIDLELSERKHREQA